MKAALLDNFGIRINLASLDSMPDYSRYYAEMFGHGILRRLWCRHLRPIVMPRKQAQIERAWAGARADLMQEFLLVILAADGLHCE